MITRMEQEHTGCIRNQEHIIKEFRFIKTCKCRCQAKIHDVHDVLSMCVHIVQCHTHLHIIAALSNDGE
jgi:hypothetical protein